MSTNAERDELAELLANTRYPNLVPAWPERADRSPVKFLSRKEADAILSAGYSKSTTLGYVVVGRDGRMLGSQYSTRGEAQAMADEWTKDCEVAGVDWEYRVAEITEPTP